MSAAGAAYSREYHTWLEDNLREALVDEIRDLYNAEKQLVKALPKMAKGATSDELREAFESHLEETEGQVTRLERVFELLDEKPRGKHCAGMAGIIEEGSETLEEDMEDAVMDACSSRRRAARRALRDRPRTAPRSRGPKRSSLTEVAQVLGRRSPKRRPRTRSCRRWPNPASTKPRRRASRKTRWKRTKRRSEAAFTFRRARQCSSEQRSGTSANGKRRGSEAEGGREEVGIERTKGEASVRSLRSDLALLS